MELAFTKARTPTGAGRRQWSKCQGQGISSKGQEMPERKTKPTEKKAMSNRGASLSLKKMEHDKPKKAVANKKGISNRIRSNGVAKCGKWNNKGRKPMRNTENEA